jgi:hypothetical protein
LTNVSSPREGEGEGERETYLDSAVERAKDMGVILGMVARNPLLRLNGRGQNRMPVRYQMPSLLSTWPSATNRGSLPTMRSMYLLSTVRLARKAHRLPATQAAATMGQPRGNP